MTTANQLAGYASSLPNFRNRFINGDQVVDQRHAGSAGTASANTFTYATDRWYIYSVGATCGYQRVAGPNTSDYALQITPAVSNTNSIVGQKIENLNCLDLANKTVTISGKVYIDNASGVTFNTNVYVASSANSSYGNVVAFSSTLTSGQYVDFSGTVTLGANAINGIEVDFSFLSAAGKTIKLTNLQLELGTVATPFEHRPISVELGLCQRYYEKSFNLSTAPANNTSETTVIYSHLQSGYGFVVPIVFKERKRAAGASTIVYNPYSTTANRAAWVASANQAFTHSNVGGITETGFYVKNFSSPLATPDTTGNIIAFNWSAESEL